MRIGVVSLVGISAPIVTEAIDWVKKLYPKDRIYNIMIATDNEQVIKNTEFISKVINKEFGNTVVNITKILNFHDVTSNEEIVKFIDEISKILYEEETKYNLDIIFLNITGGRKIQDMLLYFISFFDNKIHKIINIINKNIALANERWEWIKGNMLDKDFSDEEYKHKVRDVMFPNETSYTVFELPRFRLPRNIIEDIYSILTMNYEEYYGSEIFSIMKESGFIAGSKEFSNTDLGNSLKLVIRRLQYGEDILY